jgi:protein phosphatase
MARFAAKTHTGRRPGANEDAIGWDTERQIWFVIDGMGGHVSGQVASQVVKSCILTSELRSKIDETLVQAHEAILQAATVEGELSGMGATAVVAEILNRSVEITWAGDSRAYLWRRGKLVQMSRDHSFVELLREQNLLSPEEIRNHPQGNLVTRTLGHGDPVPSVVRKSLHSGDWILLCSDGLNDELDDGEIAAVLGSSASVDEAVDRLVAKALAKGGRDNTSVVVVEYEGTRLGNTLVMLSGVPWIPVALGACLAILAAVLFWSDR